MQQEHEKHLEEILTFEIYQRDGKMMLCLPLANIEPTGFSLKDKNLTINLRTQNYIVNNLSERVIKFIENKKCYLIENLDQINVKTHLIDINSF